MNKIKCLDFMTFIFRETSQNNNKNYINNKKHFYKNNCD